MPVPFQKYIAWITGVVHPSKEAHFTRRVLGGSGLIIRGECITTPISRNRRYNEETKFSVTPSFVLTHSSDSI